ncbi:MerR family transcriptional regulator [Cellulomonas oligotrophica]|uniref:DNA-binding transcriptional MerR regulator n=1 Tax=Cellulomonas oligotrophica TaxID=931536 RepID=A0A7Y9FDT5_9CELL|nr:MerR family transcriptional regulator [Cellulomonas oligotrophica]NYD85450.1 DNA-binding transcriptional MerR regulator [Cellulomonas oligotrophica]GIG31541.1 hypothetical protein Col01nite_07000 [Cellulomonas oligotrophica]
MTESRPSVRPTDGPAHPGLPDDLPDAAGSVDLPDAHPAPADPSDDADAPALAVAAVARRLGVAPATLRTWDRRYGLGPSAHSAGAHRRYSARDVERLLVMRRLTIEGVAPAEAARRALTADVSAPSPAPALPSPRPAGLPGGGGVDAVVDAALAGQHDRCAGLLAVAETDDVATWWTTLVEPVLAALALRTVVDRPGVDAGATVTAAALGALRARTVRPPRPGAPVVLVLTTPGEPRPLLAHALAAALAVAGVDARTVGGPVSSRHAGELVVMTRPGALVTVTSRDEPDLGVVAWLAREHPGLAQFVMVPDAAVERVPLDRTVHRSRSFRGLLHECVAAVAPSAHA